MLKMQSIGGYVFVVMHDNHFAIQHGGTTLLAWGEEMAKEVAKFLIANYPEAVDELAEELAAERSRSAAQPAKPKKPGRK